MKRLIIFIILSITTILSGQEIDFQALRQYVDQSINAWNIPGIAVGIVHNNKLVFADGMGTRKMGEKSLIDENTVFAIASNSKAFTAAAVGMLVQRHKLNWDKRVIDILPDFQMYDPLVTAKITVRDLLCHRSGLGLWAGDLNWFNTTQTRADIIKKIRYIKPSYDFRTSFAYTNLAFLTAGETIPATVGQSWDDFLKENIFNPLDMERTTTSAKDLDDMDNLATPYIYHHGKLVPTVFENVDGVGPAASINSSVKDLGQWLKLQLNYGSWDGKQLIDSSIIFETRKPQNLLAFGPKSLEFNPYSHFISYGLGWFLRDYRGRQMVYHSGALDGMFSFVGFLPEENLGIVVLTNRDDHDLMYALAYHIIDQYMHAPFEDWSAKYLERDKQYRKRQEKKRQKVEELRDKDSKPSKEPDKYAGKYYSNVYGNSEIIEKDGELTIKMSHHPHITGKIEHWQYDTFKVKWSDPVWDESFINFDLDDNGKIEQFRMKVRPDWVDTWEYQFVKK